MSERTDAALDGRIALVTGGASGIGRAISADLDALGATVVVADLDHPGAVATAADLRRAHPRSFDLADPDSIQRLAESCVADFGGIDILVSNAGVAVVEPFATSDPATWDRLYRLNLRAPMLLTQALLPSLADSGAGRLVFIASDGARVGSGGEAAYAASKSGLFGFAKSVAREYARRSLTANVVCPGPVVSAMTSAIEREQPGLLAKLERQIPLRRLGRPEDVAGLVAFLCTDRAAYITGQTLSVSGGITMC